MSTSKILNFVLGGLLILAIGGIFYFSNQANQMQDRSVSLATELEDTRTNLEGELSEVQTSYEVQVAENDSLSVQIQEKVVEVEQLQKKIGSMRRQLASSKANATAIKEKLAKLEALKNELESELGGLKEQNEQLAAANFNLTSELNSSKAEIDNLNTQVADLTDRNEAMHNRLMTLAPAGYRADNFRVVMQKKNDKLTSKAKRVDEITVSFNLDHVPAEKQGDGEVYLAITTLGGKPVKAVGGNTVSVPAIDEQIKVDAADIQKVSLKDSQRLDMSFKMKEKLAAGEYNVLVYSNAGYLGSTGFSLR